jgi:Flp pilus assembly protein TadD/DNA-binding response OmpR family regulator
MMKAMGSDRNRAPPRPQATPIRPLPALQLKPLPRKGAAAATPSVEPTILLVGGEASFEPALRTALARHKVYVETATAAEVADTVVVTAPDLVLLAGEAARDGGSEILARLAKTPSSSVVPVAILGEDAALDERLRAFRYGAAAVIPRSASIDAIAEQVAKLAREIPERGGEALGVIGEATLSEFVTALSKELRSGILSVRPGEEGEQPVRLVLGSGRPLAAFIDEFVKRVRRHVVHAEPLHYEFDNRAGGTVRLLDPEATDYERVAGGMKGLRVALADDDAARADNVAQELRSRGAAVVVTDLAPTDVRFLRLRQVDPEVLIIGESHLEGAGYELLRRMRKDTRLRWVSLLVVRWEEIWSESISVPTLDRLEAALSSLAASDRALCDLADSGSPFDQRLEVTGPARALRALSASRRSIRLTVHNPRAQITIDLSDGLIVGATGDGLADGQHWEGALALAALLVLSSGRLHVEPVQQPASTNIMATVDVALNMADSEIAPISPSVPSPIGQSLRPPGPLSLPPPRAVEAAVPTGASVRPPRPAARAGISKPLTALLVGLAALQGLLFAALFGSFRAKSDSTAPAASASVPAAPAEQGLAPERPSSAAPASAASTAEPSPSPAPAEREPPSLLDESGTRAPTCQELLPQAVQAGDFPGAANEATRNSNKALVRGDVDEAQRALCKAVIWDSKSAQPYLDLAQLLLIRRDGAAAVEWARKATALDPLSTRAQSLLGDGLVRIGDHPGAKRAWLAAAKIQPGETEQIADLFRRSLREAELSLRKRDYLRAERFFRRGVVLDPESLAASRGLALTLFRLGDFKPAQRWSHRAVVLAPRDPDVRVILGDALSADGNKRGAEVEWREALRLDPANAEAQKRINRMNAGL